MRYLLEIFKSKAFLEEKYKCPLKLINPSVNLEGLIWKLWDSGVSSMGLNLKESGYMLGCLNHYKILSLHFSFPLLSLLYIQLHFIILVILLHTIVTCSLYLNLLKATIILFTLPRAIILGWYS